MSSSYVERTRGHITASKLKCFLNNPVEYKLKFVDEIPLEEEDKRYFVVGGAFDYLVAEGEEKFLQKYYIDDGLVKEELYQKALERGEIAKEVLSKWKLPELRAYIYNGRDEAKIRLTPGEGKSLMGMYREIIRQPLADMGSNYQTHHTIQAKYKTLVIGGELDRFSKEKGLIRDWKTTGRIDFFEYDMENTYDYIMSMAFYYTLAKVHYDIDCDVILDVVHKNEPYQFIAYKLDKQILFQKMMDKVKPGLDKLIEAYETNTREPVYPLTGQPIPRAEIMKSSYYAYMDCSLQKDFTSPM